MPLCLFEGKTYRAALKSSAELVSGHFGPVAVIVLGWFCLVALVATGAAIGFDGLGRLILTEVNGEPRVLIMTAAALIAVLTMGAALTAFLAQAGYCLLSVQLYERLGEMRGRSPAGHLMGLLEGMGMGSSRLLRWRWSTVWVVLLVFATLMAGVAFALIEDLDLHDQVQVTAHRGSSRKAPENSMSAVRQAIEDGADFAEIDVQETRDGVVVVIHDTDLMRVMGLDRKIWEVTYDEIRDLDAGSWFSPKFEGERIPTLQQVIDLTNGKIKLNIELKLNGHDQRLAERVVQILQNNRFESRCVVTSLEYGALRQVKQLDDSLRIGHIVSVAIGDITRLEVDFLSLQTNLVTAQLMAAADKRGLGVHVWTVNDPDTLVAMVNKGVENIITDEPGMMSARLRELAALSDTELILLVIGDRFRGR